MCISEQLVCMLCFHKNNQSFYLRGLTVTNILFLVALGIFIFTLITVFIVRAYAPDDSNIGVLQQTRAYISVLELEYYPLYQYYPAQISATDEVLSSLDQFGCLIIDESVDTCQFNGKTFVQYPDVEGLRQLNELVPLQSFSTMVTDQQGEVFSAIQYSSNGIKFRLRYPLMGDNMPCGIKNAYEVFTGFPEYNGVTICVYESR